MSKKIPMLTQVTPVLPLPEYSQDLQKVVDLINRTDVSSDELVIALSSITDEYEEELKIFMIALARRRASKIVNTLNMIDLLESRLTSVEKLESMTSHQMLSLLSSLTNEINSTTAFIKAVLQVDLPSSPSFNLIMGDQVTIGEIDMKDVNINIQNSDYRKKMHRIFSEIQNIQIEESDK